MSNSPYMPSLKMSRFPTKTERDQVLEDDCADDQPKIPYSELESCQSEAPPAPESVSVQSSSVDQDLPQLTKVPAISARPPKIRCRSAFEFYSIETREGLKKEQAGLSMIEQNKELRKRWQAVAPADRARFEEMAAKDKKRCQEEKCANLMKSNIKKKEVGEKSKVGARGNKSLGKKKQPRPKVLGKLKVSTKLFIPSKKVGLDKKESPVDTRASFDDSFDFPFLN